MSTEAREIADEVAVRLVGSGADAAVLTGSVATGTDHPDSDIDLIAVVRPGTDLTPSTGTVVRGRLVTVDVRTVEEVRRGFTEPGTVGTVVPGWRCAVALLDPHDLVTRLRAEAVAWTWEPIEEAADRWVAEQLTGLAEEVHKVVGLSLADRRRPAAVNRAVLAFQLAGVVGVHRRILYGSENALWNLVAEHESPEWTVAYDAALGLGEYDDRDRAAAAATLYRLTAELAADVLDEGKRAVVDLAVSVAARLAVR